MTRLRPVPIPPLFLPDANGEEVRLDVVFDKVLVVNLLRRLDRWNRIRSSLDALGVGDRLHRVDALDGNGWSGPAVTVRACAESHAQALDLVEGLGWALVLEDDAVPVPGFGKKLESFWRAERCWDLAVLGRCRGWGSFAYAITPAAARVLGEKLREGKAPADVVLLFEMPRAVRVVEAELFVHADEEDSDVRHEILGPQPFVGMATEVPRRGRSTAGEVVIRKRGRGQR